MPQYLVSGYLPDNFDPSTQDEATIEAIHALNREMIAAGVRKFACGLGPARTLRAQPNGEVLITDGPYLEAKEHVGGFWILETADLDEAVAWARKGAKACRTAIEVREIFFMPATAEGCAVRQLRTGAAAQKKESRRLGKGGTHANPSASGERGCTDGCAPNRVETAS